MQKNLTSFFGKKVAAVSPLVGSNDVCDLTAVIENNCKRAAISPSIGIVIFLKRDAIHNF